MWKISDDEPVEEPPLSENSIPKKDVEPIPPQPVMISETVFVDVKGAVNKPGLYEVKQGERMKFVIDEAGGFAENADKKQINLAVKVSDEMMVYVPAIGEKADTMIKPETTVNADHSNNKININTADQADFEELPGIGPAKAATFIQYREEHGLFTNIEEIKGISGIGEKTFEKLKEFIFVQ